MVIMGIFFTCSTMCLDMFSGTFLECFIHDSDEMIKIFVPQTSSFISRKIELTSRLRAAFSDILKSKKLYCKGIRIAKQFGPTNLVP